MEAPFGHVDGPLYPQIDGVPMGLLLGVCFVNLYMCHIVNQELAEMNQRPTTYCRYIDDCYVVRERKKNWVRSDNILKKIPFGGLRSKKV